MKNTKIDEISDEHTKNDVMMQNHTWMNPKWSWMILDELWWTKEMVWVFKGEFLMIFLLKYILSKKYDIWNS